MLRFIMTAYAAIFILLASTSVAIAIGNNNDFTGSENCLGCHAEQHQSWQGSHHDLAMQHANKDTILG